MACEIIRVLNFSGGKQSTCILWMSLLGDLTKPDLVLNANPGMESSETYRHVARMAYECGKAGIPFRTVEGPNLAHDLLSLSGRTRIDNPPYWTRPRSGGRDGQLMQKCTRHYKVAQIDRFLRQWLEEHHDIPATSGRIQPGLVEKWIGFCRGEELRVKPSTQGYVTFKYPLLELGMGHEDVSAYYERHGLEVPPRSVCNACFANRPDYYRRMAEERPADFAQAVAIDDAVRDMSSCGVEELVYVSRTRVPLSQIGEGGYEGEQLDLFSCDSGYCFT